MLMVDDQSTAGGLNMPLGGLTSLDIGVICLYLAAMLVMGVTIARQQRSTNDFFVGGRSMPSWAVGISLCATVMSTLLYLGQPGEMFRTGLSFLTRQSPIPLVLIVVCFVWIPFFMRLKLTSAYEYLEYRFNYTTRMMAAIFCLLLIFGWISVVVLTASIALVEIIRIDLALPFIEGVDGSVYTVILSVGLFSILYTTLGGIRAVIWTDVIQFVVLLIGALFTMAVVAWMTQSNIGDWIDASERYKHEEVQWFDWDVRNRTTVFAISGSLFMWMVCTHGANQMALQRYFTVRDVKAARWSYVVSALAAAVLGVILAGVGISLMFFIQEFDLPAKAGIASEIASVRNVSQDAVFPQFISYYLPSGLRGLVVAALFAAAMSTIDSGANSASTILTVDFYRRWRPGTEDEKRELRRARKFTAAMGVFIVFYTIGLYELSKGSDIISLAQKGFNCFLGPLGALFVLGMFVKRATPASVIPAVLIGEAVGIGTSYSREIFDVSFSTHLVILTAWLATFLSALAIGLVYEKTTGIRLTEDQEALMWVNVVRSEDAH
ncbi:MAG: sodium/solute symporter [Gammaproteobacteria bacterium]|nr:sodium/solute symporter [Gammaproteobacteria bacterium]MBT6890088.1 sodium/solute symporter [Gammaproteobacteria bacterium]